MPEYAWISQWAKWPNGGKHTQSKDGVWMLMTANDSHVRRCSGSLVDPSFKQAAASAYQLNDPQDQPWLARVYRLRLGPKPSKPESFFGAGSKFSQNNSHLDEEVDFTNIHLLLMMKPLSFIASRIKRMTNYYVWSSANLLDSWTLPTISLRRGRFEDVGSWLLPRNNRDSFRDVQWIRV